MLAFVGGTVPSLLWLIFWLREDKDNPEPIKLVILTFISGMLSVILVLPIEKYISGFPFSNAVMVFLWAGSEELLKYFAFSAVTTKNVLDYPIDYPIYFISTALGFAALENTLYLIKPLTSSDLTLSLITGNLRFLGSTLLHSVTSGIMGLAIGLGFFKDNITRFLYGVIGLITAIVLHGTFNFFIMENNGENFIQVFGFLWVITIIIMLLFEKLRRMGSYVHNYQSQS